MMAEVKNIYSLLRNKYPQGEYVLMAEVSNAAGFGRSNSADYIAVNLWPSRGLAINGIELKSFRNDWLRELKKPDKAENIFKYCDYFWLLTTDDTVAKIEEIPETWGWMIVNNKIKVKKEAPKLNPVAIDKGFLVSMLRRAADKTNFVHVDSIQERIDAAKEEALNSRYTENKFKIERANELITIVDEFEKSSGLQFGSWAGYKPEKIGAAVKFILDGGTEKVKKELQELKNKSDYISNKLNAALNDFTEQ